MIAVRRTFLSTIVPYYSAIGEAVPMTIGNWSLWIRLREQASVPPCSSTLSILELLQPGKVLELILVEMVEAVREQLEVLQPSEPSRRRTSSAGSVLELQALEVLMLNKLQSTSALSRPCLPSRMAARVESAQALVEAHLEPLVARPVAPLPWRDWAPPWQVVVVDGVAL